MVLIPLPISMRIYFLCLRHLYPPAFKGIFAAKRLFNLKYAKHETHVDSEPDFHYILGNVKIRYTSLYL